jgi:molybdate transport system substrate-binding protein
MEQRDVARCRDQESDVETSGWKAPGDHAPERAGHGDRGGVIVNRRRRGLLLLLPAGLALLLGGLLALSAVGAAPDGSAPAAAQGGELTVFAAASLTDAFDELGGLFESQQSGSRVRFNYGASSQLRTQLEQGARGDVFASADQAQMDQARAAGLVAGAAPAFARNALVLLTPRDNPGRIETLADLARPGLRLVTTAPQVPVGSYTRQVLAKLSDDPAYGADFASRVLANVRSEEDNVRAVVAKVQLGEADGGVVYTSDVTPAVAPEVRTIAIPDAVNVIAAYPIAVVADARQPALAQRFVDLVLSDAGQEVLARYGFQLAP